MSPPSNDEITSLSHRQLQEECHKANLSAAGTSKVLRRRLRCYEIQHRQAKRQKLNIADDLVCPITRELPYVPVTAQDGRIYERSAIERHFASTTGSLVKSPVTNQIMSDNLLPSPQFKNHIETLVENGVITGELAEGWNKKAQQEAEKRILLQKARGGDGDAMYQVGRNYRNGLNGFPQDVELAFGWYKKAHIAGNLRGTERIGLYLMIGRGVEANLQQGVAYTSIAAARGSDCAAYRLGYAFGKPSYGFERDREQAIFWLDKCLTMKRNLSERHRARARLLLQEIVSIEDSSSSSDEEEVENEGAEDSSGDDGNDQV